MSVIKIRKGLDVPIHGGLVSTEIVDGPAIRTVALLPADFPGMKPRLSIAEGDRVELGQPLFVDRRDDTVPYVSPGTGTVAAVHRGERRKVLSVVVALDESREAPSLEPMNPAAVSAEQVRDRLMQSGLWTGIRQRPFNRVASSTDRPRSLFVTASDTAPLAPPPRAVLAGREDAFTAGLAALAKLPEKATYLCAMAGQGFADLLPAEGVVLQEFLGPHPAGNAGVHINALDPVGPNRLVWHIGYQDVADFGALLLGGRLPQSRVVAVVGPAAGAAKLVRTRRGAAVKELLADVELGDSVRAVSGSPLSGWITNPGTTTGYLGQFANQLTLLDDEPQRRFLGWIAPFGDRHSFSNAYLGKLFQRRFRFDTDMNGSLRAIVPTGNYDEVLPMDILATPLIRALASGDLESAEKLGVLELAEEDVALCEYVCPSKLAVTRLLRSMLDEIEREG